MNDYLTIIKTDLLKIIDQLIKDKIIKQEFNKLNLSLDYLSKVKQGDVSSNLFILLNKNKVDQNKNIKTIIEEKLLEIQYIREFNFANAGFINFFLKKDFIFDNIKQVLDLSESYGNNKSGKNKNINVEFVSANPTGPIHIAHMRGAVLGDVISSILESNGYNVTREYYVNDSGTQIHSLGNSLYKRYQELFNIKVDILENEYPGSYLIPIAKSIADSDKDKWLNYDKSERKQYFEKYAVKILTNNIKVDLASINVNFDNFIYESNIVKSNLIKKIFSLLNEKQLIYEGFLEKPKGEDNNDWKPRKQLLFKASSFFDDKDRALKKEDGEWTYFANDAAYHYDKFSRNFDQLINIWGADHIGYINRMKSIVTAFSNKNDYLKICVCQIVRLLSDGKLIKMSKRDDNFVTLKEILNKVGKDSIRYFMISNKSETPMDFDMNKVVEKNKDNPVFYCQYAYARASSVINKAKEFDSLKNFKSLVKEADISSLSEYEWEIILKILSWPFLLKNVSDLKQPHKITNYLEGLCSDFHSFWNKGKENINLRIIDDKNINKTISKLIWIESFRIVLKRAFSIIGIEHRENM